jgi:hypothetical protein
LEANIQSIAASNGRFLVNYFLRSKGTKPKAIFSTAVELTIFAISTILVDLALSRSRDTVNNALIVDQGTPIHLSSANTRHPLSSAILVETSGIRSSKCNAAAHDTLGQCIMKRNGDATGFLPVLDQAIVQGVLTIFETEELPVAEVYRSHERRAGLIRSLANPEVVTNTDDANVVVLAIFVPKTCARRL